MTRLRQCDIIKNTLRVIKKKDGVLCEALQLTGHIRWR